MNYQTNKPEQIINAFQMTKTNLTSTKNWPKWLKDTWYTTTNEAGALFSCTEEGALFSCTADLGGVEPW